METLLGVANLPHQVVMKIVVVIHKIQNQKVKVMKRV